MWIYYTHGIVRCLTAVLLEVYVRWIAAVTEKSVDYDFYDWSQKSLHSLISSARAGLVITFWLRDV
jgi:hypothetical protein